MLDALQFLVQEFFFHACASDFASESWIETVHFVAHLRRLSVAEVTRNVVSSPRPPDVTSCRADANG